MVIKLAFITSVLLLVFLIVADVMVRILFYTVIQITNTTVYLVNNNAVNTVTHLKKVLNALISVNKILINIIAY